MKDSLDFIYKQQKELSVIGGIGALLGWDQMTYMPKNGAIERSEQTAFLSKLAHEKVVSDKFWKHIKTLKDEKNFEKLNEVDKNVVKRLYLDVEKSRKIPSSFVEKIAKATTLSYQAWEKAREKNDFKVFEKNLKEIIELEKEYCSYIDLPGPRYNTLLDDYEEGMTANILKKEFSYLKKELKRMIEKIKESNVYQNQKEIDINFSPDGQKKLCDLIIKKIGLSNDKARLDESTHPFTTSIGNNDVRITTSFKRKGAFFSFFSTVHEAGHGLYELNMPKEKYKNTVISDSPSLGLHESQSRFWENMIARRLEFWKYFYPEFVKIDSNIKKIDFESWYRNVNLVKPSLIRVEADELTYCLHVILRFELELEIMEDKINISDLPELWSEKMHDMLDIKPKTDVDGVLQDMHWSGGNIGYFPTYAIGSIYSSQLFNKISSENKGIFSEIENAEFDNIVKWLNDNIHKYGRMYTADEIIKKCCGERLNSKIFVDYLKDKYYPLYEL